MKCEHHYHGEMPCLTPAEVEVSGRPYCQAHADPIIAMLKSLKDPEAVKRAKIRPARRTKPEYTLTLYKELTKAIPWRKPIPNELIVLERFVRSLFFKTATVRIVEAGRTGNEWNDYAWVHQARRDRSDGGHTFLCTRKEAWTLLDDVCSLGYNLWEIGDLAGIPPDQNPYKNDDSSRPPWKSVSQTPIVPPEKSIAKKKSVVLRSAPKEVSPMDKVIETLKAERAVLERRLKNIDGAISLLSDEAERKVVKKVSAPTHKPHARTYTDAQRKAMSDAVKKAIAKKKKGK